MTAFQLMDVPVCAGFLDQQYAAQALQMSSGSARKHQKDDMGCTKKDGTAWSYM